MSDTLAVSVEGVSKKFRLFHERNQTLKATLLRRRRARYEEFWALRDVTFDIPAGRTFGLIGENGSGKSTLLKCIARILSPDAGRVVSHGKISALLELGAGFHPELSGRDNIYLNGAILGLTRKELQHRYDDIVAFAGLEQFIDTPVKNYSSGMYMRLGFSIAINVDPDILLVDEILAVGDEQFQRQCNDKFAELRERGKTIVIVTHALGSVRTLCDDVALLEHGKLKAVGSASDVIDEYLSDAATAVPDGHDGWRIGSGEAQIQRVEVLDSEGRMVERMPSGESCVFRIHYRTQQPVERPVFGLAVFTASGIEVTGPNTRLDGLEIDKIDGAGHIDLRVPRLLLVPGIYDLAAAIVDDACLHTYDHRHRVMRFEVAPGHTGEQSGVTSLGGEWVGEGLQRRP